MKSVLMVIAPSQFRDEEYAEPKAVLEAAGATVWATILERVASGSTLDDPTFYHFVLEVQERYGIDPRQICQHGADALDAVGMGDDNDAGNIHGGLSSVDHGATSKNPPAPRRTQRRGKPR